MKSTRIIALAVALCTAFLFSSCASTSIDQQKLVAKLAVQYAVLKVADKHPEKAAKIVAIAKEVQALAGKDGANTVDALVLLVRAKVDFSKLDAADTLLANTLIDAVAVELKARVGSGQIPVDKLPLVAEVAGWVAEQAALLTKV